MEHTPIITNLKIAGFTPRWAAFRGFSLLFDNPGAPDGLARLDNRVEADPDLGLYQALARGLEQIDAEQLTRAYLFCPLPPASYHITVWDGVNAANLGQVTPAERERCARLLRDLPHSLPAVAEWPELAGCALLAAPDWNVRLRFGQLENWSGVSLVANLSPADPAAARALEQVAAARRALSAAFGPVYGMQPDETFAPHITLGYFANRDLAAQAERHVAAWNTAVSQSAAERTLNVRTISLYGFTDMANFFKAPAAPG